ATMPRLDLSPEQARDLASYLTRDEAKLDDPGTRALPSGSLERGRALLEAKGCGGCHAFTGAPPLPTVPTVATGTDAQKKAVQLAPDLRLVRERFRADALVDWLVAPSSLKADTLMPSHSLTGPEANDLATYLTRVELRPITKTPLPPRLPVLSRRVTYHEVENRVLSITCRHCHGNPDVAGGDGGPGNTGGFGFLPRGLDLSTYRSAAAGLMREDGQRHSLFEHGPDGMPLLVAALRARQSEEAGQPVAGVRGMPLGLPAISAVDLQLVETWVAQGRPL
ncbi:MAG TPA: cytochrome C oxidase Cbb3, partial [Polyangiaceae bacterium]